MAVGLTRRPKTLRVYKTFGSDRDLILAKEDCLEFIKTIPSESIDLTVDVTTLLHGQEVRPVA